MIESNSLHVKSTRSELANLACYGGGALFGASLIGALFLRATGLQAKLSQAGLKHTGKLLLVSSSLSGVALIIGLCCKRKVVQPLSESADDVGSSSDSTDVEVSDSSSSTEESRSEAVPHRWDSYSWKTTWAPVTRMVSSSQMMIVRDGGDIEVKEQEGQIEILAHKLPVAGRVLLKYKWVGVGRPSDPVGSYLLDRAREASQVADGIECSADEVDGLVDRLARGRRAYQWGDGRRLGGDQQT